MSALGFERAAAPLFFVPSDAPTRARFLDCEKCSVDLARSLISKWHSRLPKTQPAPWMHSFRAHYNDTTYAVALWNNPSARTLPNDWIELRRMAVASDAPHCTASWFLAAMEKWIRENTNHPVMISYQDTAVHAGTIYKAAGWVATNRTKYRVRDRSKLRPNGRIYRKKQHGVEVDASEKVRWQKTLILEAAE